MNRELDGKDWSYVELVAHHPPGPRSINDWCTGRAIVSPREALLPNPNAFAAPASRERGRVGARERRVTCWESSPSPAEQCPANTAYVPLSYRAASWQGKERVLHLERRVVDLKHRVVRDVCDVGIRKVFRLSQVGTGARSSGRCERTYPACSPRHPRCAISVCETS